MKSADDQIRDVRQKMNQLSEEIQRGEGWKRPSESKRSEACSRLRALCSDLAHIEGWLRALDIEMPTREELDNEQ
jgi:hypothetical protein